MALVVPRGGLIVTRGGLKERRWKLVRARREAVPTSVRKMHHRPWRPSLRSAKPWLTAVAGVAALALLGSVVYGTSVLGVREVEVTGSVLASADQVRSVAAVTDGTPLARVDTDAIAARVLTLPSVDSVDVSRSWPHTLVIAVTERTPVGVVPVEGGFAVIDDAGVIFNRIAEPPAGAILVRVNAPGPDDPATKAALHVLSALTPALRENLAEVVAESPTRIRLRLTDDRVIVWGDAERSDIKATVATALLSTDANTIDVSVPDVATTR